jgi:hypothetical protein
MHPPVQLLYANKKFKNKNKYKEGMWPKHKRRDISSIITIRKVEVIDVSSHLV